MMKTVRAMPSICASAFLLGSVVVDSMALAQDGQVEVMHFWTSGGEAAAVAVLQQALEDQGIAWLDAPVAGGGGENAATVLRARVIARDAPTAAQMLGFGIREWAREGVLANLDTVAEAEGWAELVPAAVADFSMHDGHWVAAPVNIHRPNWIWGNAGLFAEHGLELPTTWDEFNAVAAEFQSLGILPLAHGGQPWQDATIFDAVVLGIGGPEFYRRAIHEQDLEALTGDTMLQVFDQMRTIRGFVDANFPGRDWNLASAMVASGEAAMQIMGDWAKGEFIAAGLIPGEDILCAPAPGTSGSFLFNADAFGMFQVGEDERPAQLELARQAMGLEFQEEFNLVKGSIPARRDVSPARFDACGQRSFEDLAEADEAGTLLGSLAHYHGAPAAVQRAFFDVVTAHFNSDMSSADAVDLLRQTVLAAQ